MKLIDVDFPEGDNAIQAEVDFTYDPSGLSARKWTNIVSLNKSDKEASFVFRVSNTENCFQLYFGDGTSVKGKVSIQTGGFGGKRCLLTCTRTSDFTFVHLSSGDLKVTRFVVHRGAVTFQVPAEHYQEGKPKDGITVHSADFNNLDVDDFSLDAVELELASGSSIHESRHHIKTRLALAAAYFWKHEYSRSLALVRSAYHLDPSRINLASFAQARSCINALHSGKNRPDAWKDFSSPDDVMFAEAKEAALRRDAEKSARIFDVTVHRVLGAPPYLYSEPHRERICAAYFDLVKFAGRPPPRLPQKRSIKKVIVSGLGWSGSGAVYDYLREFDGVMPILGETPYIEGNSSLQAIHESLDDERRLKERTLDFFFHALMGHGHFRYENDFKLFKQARSKLCQNEHEKHVTSLEGWCALATAVCAANGQARRDIFADLADHTINQFSIGRELPPGKIALLDNVVHIVNADACLPFLRDTTLLCVFRDPRSNYVALVREAPYFGKSAESYVHERKRRLPRCVLAAEAAATLADRCSDRTVEIIRFEEFVLSDGFRVALALDLGLDPKSQRRFSHFKPWESMRNVELHQEHPDQDEIDLIRAELGEYCVEPDIRPLNEVNQG